MKPYKGLTEARVRLINTKAHAVAVHLEPWGDVFDMLPEDEFVLVFHGPSPVEAEVELCEEGITVYGWTGSMVHVFKNRELFLNYDGITIPAIP
jgi:hypothetical protein